MATRRRERNPQGEARLVAAVQRRAQGLGVAVLVMDTPLAEGKIDEALGNLTARAETDGHEIECESQQTGQLLTVNLWTFGDPLDPLTARVTRR